MSAGSIKQILSHHLGEKMLRGQDLREFYDLLVRVLFCTVDATALPRFFVSRGLFKLARDVRELKLALLANGYTLRDCKFFVHAVATKNATPQQYGAFNVHRDDARALLEAAERSGVNTFCRAVAKQMPYVSMEKFERALGAELLSAKMTEFMNKFIHKKLKWVMNTQGVSAQDLRTEFISHSIIRAYRTYPRIENRTHLRNLLKQVIHARGQSIIGETAKGKRNNLIRDASGSFLGRLAPLHLMPSEVMEENREHLSCQITGGSVDAARDWEFRQDLRASIRAASTSVSRHKFLTAVFQAERCPEFLAQLSVGMPRRICELTSELPQEELHGRLMELAPEFLVTRAIEFSGLEPNTAVGLLQSIKDNCISD